MVPDNQTDHSRLFLHPTENQLWANAIGDQDLEFPKYSAAMTPVCDQSQYECLVRTLSQMLKTPIHMKEDDDVLSPCLANFICIASLGICFCPFLYWSCKKNKEMCDPSQFETKVSTLVSKQTKDWSGMVTIRRENLQTYGEFLCNA